MKETIYVFLIVGIVFVYGCSTGTQAGIESEKINLKKEIGENTALTQLAGSASQYYRFDKAHFENSLREGKVIFLDFHADWCSICQSENPGILAAFNELDDEGVVGYLVHYDDGQTTEDDKEMAKKYGIPYQHTKVIIGKDGKVALKSLEVFSREKVINELNKALVG